MPQHKMSIWEGTAPEFSSMIQNGLKVDLDVDVAIIGGGITGITLADILQHQGMNICLLERNELMSGTSGQTSAHLSTYWDMGYSEIKKNHGEHAARTLYQALKAGLDHIKNRSALWHDQIEFKDSVGYIYDHPKGDGKDSDLDLSEEKKICEMLGMSVEDMPKDLLPFKIAKGFAINGQARFHPVKYLEELLSELASNPKLYIYEHSPVIEMDKNLLKTPHASVRAKYIVQATHIPSGVDLVQTALKPFRSYVIAGPSNFELPEGLYWDTKEPYHYIRKEELGDEQLLVIGGDDQKTGKEHETEHLKSLKEYAKKYFGMTDVKYEWSAQLYEPADGLPIVGKKNKDDSTFIATGFSGDGLTMGTASALMIADIITSGSHPWEKTFSPDRNFLFYKDYLKHNIDVTKHMIKDRIVADEMLIDELYPNTGHVEASLTSPIAYYRDNYGKLHTMSAVCPHLKCTVHWNDLQKSFDCPCHGSRFDTDGSVIEGPALHGLKKIEP